MTIVHHYERYSSLCILISIAFSQLTIAVLGGELIDVTVVLRLCLA